VTVNAANVASTRAYPLRLTAALRKDVLRARRAKRPITVKVAGTLAGRNGGTWRGTIWRPIKP
jgi:hypothetical protein